MGRRATLLHRGPNLHQFIALLGSVPEWVDDRGWAYGARFRCVRIDDELLITVAPAQATLEIAWRQADWTRLVASLYSVTLWVIEQRGAEGRLLVNDDTQPKLRRCTVRIRPTISVELTAQG